MGLASAGDEFCRWADSALTGLPYLLKIVDDMLIQAPTMSVLRSRCLHEVLLCCRQAGIKLSLSKMDYGTSLKFAGFIVSDKGVTADPDEVSAIRDFPVPKSVTEIRSFLGLV